MTGLRIKRSLRMREFIHQLYANNVITSVYSVGKPTIMTGFGLVTQGNAPDFVPFNMTTPVDSSGSGACRLTCE